MSEILKTFKFDKVLSQNVDRKSIALLGTVGASNKAIFILEKAPYNMDTINNDLQFNNNNNNNDDDELTNKLVLRQKNDIYSKYEFFSSNVSIQNMTMIYPATDAHILKYSSTEHAFIKETYEIYDKVVRDHVEKAALKLNWVWNMFRLEENESKVADGETIILNHKQSGEEFVLAYDYQWNGEQLDDLHLIAILKDCSLRSIRDLRGKHVLIERIKGSNSFN
ncbi:hypothetical protein ACOME3_005926 [Neoechinorhynchus agilis]